MTAESNKGREAGQGSKLTRGGLLLSLFGNTTSMIGAACALVALINILFLFFIDFVSGKSTPYVGIFAYMIMPGFLLFGLFLMAIGAWRAHRRRLRGEEQRFPRIDLNVPAQRSALLAFLVFISVFLLMSAFGSYRAYQYSDSVEFCGQTCHTVMNPEYTAYLGSPHARVACVDCHVGTGAGWYVKSKLSGAYQVYSAAFHKYPRPIPSPVESLRPAQDTCEQCHWPQRFIGAQLKVFTHYGNDEKNTPRQIQMLIKTGGGDPHTGQAAGIHWHMNISNEITYIATDRQRQTIPWVQVKDLQGRVTVYQSKDNPLTADQIAKLPKRRMDCVDCHNRPTHVYVPPDRSVDRSMLARRIDSSLPFIKVQAVTALSQEYKTTDEALKGISTALDTFYSTKYPQVYKDHQDLVRNAIAEVQNIYRNTIFPEMKVDWRVHPDNIGHFYSPGCFRCHDGNHLSADGKPVRKECTICHNVLAQEESGIPLIATNETTTFKHPVDLGDMSGVSCTDCHNGGVGP